VWCTGGVGRPYAAEWWQRQRQDPWQEKRWCVQWWWQEVRQRVWAGVVAGSGRQKRRVPAGGPTQAGRQANGGNPVPG